MYEDIDMSTTFFSTSESKLRQSIVQKGGDQDILNRDEFNASMFQPKSLKSEMSRSKESETEFCLFVFLSLALER